MVLLIAVPTSIPVTLGWLSYREWKRGRRMKDSNESPTTVYQCARCGARVRRPEKEEAIAWPCQRAEAQRADWPTCLFYPLFHAYEMQNSGTLTEGGDDGAEKTIL